MRGFHRIEPVKKLTHRSGGQPFCMILEYDLTVIGKCDIQIPVTVFDGIVKKIGEYSGKRRFVYFPLDARSSSSALICRTMRP